MPWVRFTHNFDFTVKRRPFVVQSFKAGATYLVSQKCASAAIESHVAELTERPVKDDGKKTSR